MPFSLYNIPLLSPLSISLPISTIELLLQIKSFWRTWHVITTQHCGKTVLIFSDHKFVIDVVCNHTHNIMEMQLLRLSGVRASFRAPQLIPRDTCRLPPAIGIRFSIGILVIQK